MKNSNYFFANQADVDAAQNAAEVVQNDVVNAGRINEAARDAEEGYEEQARNGLGL
ncbi:hypothetical protein Lpar_0802 [Legionella parisiensis]|uniref:Uncharacterized protein n=2 Tax=Legionella parisiensis TaxID=45071 RepID=A0A1E5JM47_9GAMM|nr:hypothetical protein Lpar_0802 [Legionella parisiensis]OEH45550.1 hypothetical protein lpari_03460 [Legionella parisiensis]STX78101.1 Uncharacterised protein [Legionella parisiensis]